MISKVCQTHRDLQQHVEAGQLYDHLSDRTVLVSNVIDALFIEGIFTFPYASYEPLEMVQFKAKALPGEPFDNARAYIQMVPRMRVVL